MLRTTTKGGEANSELDGGAECQNLDLFVLLNFYSGFHVHVFTSFLALFLTENFVCTISKVNAQKL